MSTNKENISKANWREWENKFKKYSSDVSVNGWINIKGREIYHTIKLILFFSTYIISYFIITQQFPGFNKLSFCKLIIFCIIGESIGVCCTSGPLGGKLGNNKITSYWYNINIGTCKIPSLQFLSKTRSIIDIIIYLLFICLLIYSFIIINENTIHHSFPLLFIFILFIWFWITDRTIFLGARAEYYGQYLLCIYFTNGWFSACQLLQIAIWIWAGISKLGLWFYYVYPIMTASSPIIQLSLDNHQKLKFTKALYKNYPNDLRPGKFSIFNAYFGVILEIGAGVFMLHSMTRVLAIACFILLHSFIIINFPAGAVQEWNICNILFSLYLFHFGCNDDHINWNFILYKMDFRLQMILICTLIIVPMISNINPDIIDFLIGYRYYAGNWQNGIWIINKKKWDNKIIPNIVTINSIYSDNYNNESKKRMEYYNRSPFGFRIISTPTGKSTLNLMKKLFYDNKHCDNIGYKLNCNDYMLLDESDVCGMMFGFNWHSNPYNHSVLKARLDQLNVSKYINKYDIIVIYIQAIPTFSCCCREPSFGWRIFDYKHNLIDCGIFKVSQIDNIPHFETFV